MREGIRALASALARASPHRRSPRLRSFENDVDNPPGRGLGNAARGRFPSTDFCAILRVFLGVTLAGNT